jgi:hypothetical protein
MGNFLTVRVANWLPPPHVVLHALQGDQSFISQGDTTSTGFTLRLQHSFDPPILQTQRNDNLKFPQSFQLAPAFGSSATPFTYVALQ